MSTNCAKTNSIPSSSALRRITSASGRVLVSGHRSISSSRRGRRVRMSRIGGRGKGAQPAPSACSSRSSLSSISIISQSSSAHVEAGQVLDPAQPLAQRVRVHVERLRGGRDVAPPAQVLLERAAAAAPGGAGRIRPAAAAPRRGGRARGRPGRRAAGTCRRPGRRSRRRRGRLLTSAAAATAWSASSKPGGERRRPLARVGHADGQRVPSRRTPRGAREASRSPPAVGRPQPDQPAQRGIAVVEQTSPGSARTTAVSKASATTSHGSSRCRVRGAAWSTTCGWSRSQPSARARSASSGGDAPPCDEVLEQILDRVALGQPVDQLHAADRHRGLAGDRRRDLARLGSAPGASASAARGSRPGRRPTTIGTTIGVPAACSPHRIAASRRPASPPRRADFASSRPSSSACSARPVVLVRRPGRAQPQAAAVLEHQHVALLGAQQPVRALRHGGQQRVLAGGGARRREPGRPAPRPAPAGGGCPRTAGRSRSRRPPGWRRAPGSRSRRAELARRLGVQRDHADHVAGLGPQRRGAERLVLLLLGLRDDPDPRVGERVVRDEQRLVVLGHPAGEALAALEPQPPGQRAVRIGARRAAPATRRPARRSTRSRRGSRSPR